MLELTASEASRNFSSLLDRAAAGETIVITRGGRRVATIGPAEASNGAAVRGVLDRWRGTKMLDDSFADRVAGARSVVSAELDSDPWRD